MRTKVKTQESAKSLPPPEPPALQVHVGGACAFSFQRAGLKGLSLQGVPTAGHRSDEPPVTSKYLFRSPPTSLTASPTPAQTSTARCRACYNFSRHYNMDNLPKSPLNDTLGRADTETCHYAPPLCQHGRPSSRHMATTNNILPRRWSYPRVGRWHSASPWKGHDYVIVRPLLGLWAHTANFKTSPYVMQATKAQISLV